VVVSLVIVSAFAAAAPAFAHADLVSTHPVDGSVLASPPDELVIEFTEAIVPTGPGLRVIDANRSNIDVTVFQPTDSSLAAVFEEPIGEGRFVVFWSVRSDDGHEESGAFSFEVAPEGATATTTQGTIAPDTTSTSPFNPPTTTLAPMGSVPEGPPSAFSVWDLTAGFGRWAALAGAVLAIGSFTFAAVSLVGSKEEVRRTVTWMRRGGVLVVAGTLVEVSSLALAAGSFPGAFAPRELVTHLTSSYLVAVVFRVIGGVALLQQPALAAVTRVPGYEPAAHRLDGRQEWLTIAALLSVLASFAFDGHTATMGILGKIASVAHVGAAGVWVGGVWVMADIVIVRHREGRDRGTSPMALRFSRVAAAALAVLLAAGIALAISLVDEPGDIFGGTWGRVLIVKVTVVAAAAAIGTYNHFSVVPKLSDSDPSGAGRFRQTLVAESALFVGVTLLTAVLVASAP